MEKKTTHFPFALLLLTQLYLAEKHQSSHSHTLPPPCPVLGSKKPEREGRALHPTTRHEQSLEMPPAAFWLSARIKQGPWRGDSSPRSSPPSSATSEGGEEEGEAACR